MARRAVSTSIITEKERWSELISFFLIEILKMLRAVLYKYSLAPTDGKRRRPQSASSCHARDTKMAGALGCCHRVRIYHRTAPCRRCVTIKKGWATYIRGGAVTIEPWTPDWIIVVYEGISTLVLLSVIVFTIYDGDQQLTECYRGSSIRARGGLEYVCICVCFSNNIGMPGA